MSGCPEGRGFDVGYSYDMRGRLCCDNCGEAGGVRKRLCPAKVLGDSSRSPRQETRYCYPPAVCSGCWTPALRAETHDECHRKAAEAQQEYDLIEKRMRDGDLLVVAARAAHDGVPDGMVLVTFAAPFRDGRVQWSNYLVPDADYVCGGHLSDYPNAVPVTDPALVRA